VIYIAGTSHSGSTLLDLMLNAHPDIISVGELAKLKQQVTFQNRKPRNAARCSCGASSILECSFWIRVNQWLIDQKGRTLADLELDDRCGHDWRSANELLFSAIAQTSGKKFIIDSSKDPTRLRLLLKLPSLNVFPVHLIRSPKGHVYSLMRKHGGFFRHIAGYEFVHAKIRSLVTNVPHTVVYYEDLASQPECTLKTVLQPHGLKFETRQLEWSRQEKHSIAGNRLRLSQSNEVRLDEAWKRSLNQFQKTIIDVGTIASKLSKKRPGFIGARGRP
jgi:Sulfotransferase family